MGASVTPHHVGKIWSVAVDPVDTDTIFVGTCPASIFRSRDGGRRWENLPIPNVVSWCETGFIRVSHMVISPDDPRNIFAGLEVDGVRRSLDGRDTWTYVEGGWLNERPDLHHMAIVKENGTTRILAATAREIYTSTDMGESWEATGAAQQFGKTDTFYLRWTAIKPYDPRVMFAALGNGAVGDSGGIARSKDGGATWDLCPLPDKPNSTMYGMATNPADPNIVVACSLNGEVYMSEDAGDSWRKSEREFGEVLCIAWQPN